MVKVNAHGIQGDAARWIRNWIAGRRQRVCVHQSYSNWAPVTSGVPQGSVLGLLLFLIYINDLDTNIVSKMSKFADDTKLWKRARNPDDIVELQEDINKHVEWANKWQMGFNVDNVLWYTSDTTTMQSNYNMSNQQMPRSDQQWDLGIIITKDLMFQKQTEKSCKTKRVLGFIARNCRYKNKELIPHLEHAVQFWSTHVIIIIIKKRSAVQGWERVVYTLSVRRPQPHNTNL